MANILAVDDEQQILTLIKNALVRDGHQVTCVESADQISLSDIGWYDIIILDVCMPGTDGFSFCKEIRDIVDCPILFLTAKSMEDDLAYGLSIGGDDYIRKPFSLSELRARVNAHLRREHREKSQCLTVDDVRFFLGKSEAFMKEDKIPFTKSEYQICEFLARNHGQVYTKEQIYEHVFGYDGNSDISAITEHIKNIRRKLSQYSLTVIETVWGIGYRWR